MIIILYKETKETNKPSEINYYSHVNFPQAKKSFKEEVVVATNYSNYHITMIICIVINFV
jgi:hypothetical protein